MPPLKGVTRHRRDYPPALAPSGGTRAVTGTEFSGGVPGKAQFALRPKRGSAPSVGFWLTRRCRGACFIPRQELQSRPAACVK